MGQTGHSRIGCKLNIVRCNSAFNTASKVININTDLNEYVPETILNKEVRVKFKNVDSVVSSIKPFPFAGAKALSNPNNITISSVNCCKNVSSTSSWADLNIVSDEISNLYYHNTW